MATTTEYAIESELTEVVSAVLNKPEHSEFKPLRDLEIIISSCFVIKTDKDGATVPTSGDAVKVKKVSSLLRLFMKPKPHYLLVVDYHAWENVDNREAMIHEALLKINVERNEAGSIVLGSRGPDIKAFAKNIERYGSWNASLKDVRESFRRSDKMLPRRAPAPEPEPVTDEA